MFHRAAPILTAALPLLVLAAAAHAEPTDTVSTPAPNADRRQLSLGLQRDAQGHQLSLAQLGLAVGQRGWVQLGAGRAADPQAAGAGRTGIASVGAGYIAEGMHYSLGLSQRSDGSRYRQTDVSASVDWLWPGVKAGLDLTHRSARSRVTVADANAPGGSAPATQRVRATGVGLHAAYQVSQRVQVYGAAMRYRPSISTRADGASQDSGLLGQVLGRQPSAVNRDETVLNRSLQWGASYQLSPQAAVNADVLSDRLPNGAGSVNSLQLKAAITVAPAWLLTPGVGRSRATGQPGVNYGLLSLSHGW
jgi:hypothetical protein